MNEVKEHRIVMVFSRKKDNPNQRKSTVTMFQDIVPTDRVIEKEPMYNAIAKLYNARVYVSVNTINFKEARKDLIMRLLKQQFEGMESNIHRALISSCMRSPNKPKQFMLDIDTKLPSVLTFVRKNIPKKHIVITTQNGYHIICEPFNVKEFMDLKIPDVEIKKNGMTNLEYIKRLENE